MSAAQKKYHEMKQKKEEDNPSDQKVAFDDIAIIVTQPKTDFKENEGNKIETKGANNNKIGVLNSLPTFK